MRAAPDAGPRAGWARTPLARAPGTRTPGARRPALGRDATGLGGRVARLVRAVVVGGLLGLVTIAGAAPAAASDPEDVITRYSLWIDLGADGVARVRLDLTVDFGTTRNRGPYLRWVVSEHYDATHDRVYRIRDVRATSPTAPAGVRTEEILGGASAETAYMIGDPDVWIRGVHEYTVTFEVEGWVNSAGYPWPAGPLTEDELYLNVLTHWDIPVEQVRIQVTAPAEPRQVACYDDGSGTCRTGIRDSVATFAIPRVEPRSPLTIALGYPAGTFGGVEPLLKERWSPDRAFSVTPGTVGAAAAIGLGGAALLIGRVRRVGRDEQYADLPPGMVPAFGQPTTVGARRTLPVAVQFTPPAGFRPGQLGTLIDEQADPHDVTATIIDLAVRQYLRIVRLPPTNRGADEDWRLDRSTKPDVDLAPYERMLLDGVFTGRWSVTLSEIRSTFAASMTKVQDALYADVTALGWFRRNPKHARAAWSGWGMLLLLAGFVLTALLSMWTHWGIVGLPVIGLGVLMLALTRKAPARTAAGPAVLAQAEGFRLYLSTAEADQLRFEEGEDLFSRYLPFAVAFGLTERWATLFADLAASGRQIAEPSWFIGGYGVGFWASAGTLGNDLSAFSTAATTAFTAPDPGSSGGSGSSGFSGGGGGGGSGGGGGGTW